MIQNNNIKNNKVAVYVKSGSNQILSNKLLDNDIGIYFLDTASDNQATRNSVRQSSVFAIYSKIEKGLGNVLGVNTLDRNRKDIEGREIN